MRIALSNASPLQVQIAEAFTNRHKSSLSAFQISISIEAKREEKLEGFSLSAKRSGTKVEATIGLTLDHSIPLRIALKFKLLANLKSNLYFLWRYTRVFKINCRRAQRTIGNW